MREYHAFMLDSSTGNDDQYVLCQTHSKKFKASNDKEALDIAEQERRLSRCAGFDLFEITGDIHRCVREYQSWEAIDEDFPRN